MYNTSYNFSTLAVINILNDNQFKITNNLEQTNELVMIDLVTTITHSITKQEIEELLVNNNIYNKYLAITKQSLDTSSNNPFIINTFREEVEIGNVIVAKYRYWKGIRELTHEFPRALQIFNDMEKLRDTQLETT
jgi:hypothetical protein